MGDFAGQGEGQVGRCCHCGHAGQGGVGNTCFWTMYGLLEVSALDLIMGVFTLI